MNPWLAALLGMDAFHRHTRPLSDRPPEADLYETAEAIWDLRTTAESDIPPPEPGRGLLVVANHPRGALDVFICGGWLERSLGRPVRFVVNRMIGEVLPTLSDRLIGVDNMSRRGPERSAFNRAALTEAVAFLKSGGVLYVCPAGQVASWRLHSPEGWFKRTDHPWQSTFVALAREAQVAIQPVHLSGCNRLRYRVARLFGRIFGRMMNFREFTASSGATTHISIGDPVEPGAFTDQTDDEISRLCRSRVYACVGRTGSS